MLPHLPDLEGIPAPVGIDAAPIGQYHDVVLASVNRRRDGEFPGCLPFIVAHLRLWRCRIVGQPALDLAGHALLAECVRITQYGSGNIDQFIIRYLREPEPASDARLLHGIAFTARGGVIYRFVDCLGGEGIIRTAIGYHGIISRPVYDRAAQAHLLFDGLRLRR